MARKYLLPEKGTFYKVNMHCHTTFSDGKLTPREVKQEYIKRGYSAVAFTEHEYIAPQNQLTDRHFIAITGYEVAVNNPAGAGIKRQRTYHLNFYAKDPDQETHVCFSPDYVWGPGKQIVDTLRYTGGIFERTYDVDCVNDMIAKAREGGFLVSYNHPSWSMQPSEDYLPLRGLTSVEIYNSGAQLEAYRGWAEHVYADFCDNGIRLGCLAVDDNHNKLTRDFDSPLCESFGGWINVKAETLSYGGIIGAYEKGNYYASTGAELRELYLDGDTLTVECAPCSNVILLTGGRMTDRKASDSDDITRATFRIDINRALYVRIICENTKNQKAFSNAYFDLK